MDVQGTGKITKDACKTSAKSVKQELHGFLDQ